MKQLTNRPVAAKPQSNNPKSKAKAQGNGKNITSSKSGGKFGTFIGN